MECHVEHLNEDAQKKEEKYDAFCTSPGRDNQITTLILCMSFMNLVVIQQRLLTNEYQFGEADFSMGNYKLHCYV